MPVSSMAIALVLVVIVPGALGLGLYEHHQRVMIAQRLEATCEATNIARRDSNEHVRLPLKVILSVAALTRELSAPLESVHGHTKLGRLNAAAGRAYAKWAKEVKLTPLLNCETGKPRKQQKQLEVDPWKLLGVPRPKS